MSKTQSIARALAPAIAIAAAVACGGGANAASLIEGFDDVGLLSSNGWTQQNNSTAPGEYPEWIQGVEGFPFFAQAGDEGNSYISVDYRSTQDMPGVDTISNWLISPKMTFNNGDRVAFHTRTELDMPYPDRLQVRFGAGAAPSPGSTPLSVGNFTTLLLDINPSYAVGGYPETWTPYAATITGLSGPTFGAIAFRYFVEDGGPTGLNSNIIGLDTVSVTAAPPPPIPEPAAYLLMALGLGFIGLRRMRAMRG